jgi:hypothetical protein
MKFEDYIRIVYCKDNYNEEYASDDFKLSENSDAYYKGYLIHRENGPAVIWNDGSASWYFEGKRHRIDGPAIEYKDGRRYWYLHGKRYCEEQYYKIIKLKDNKRVLNDI